MQFFKGRYVAAAVLILAILAAFLLKLPQGKTPAAVTVKYKNDVAPGHNGAVLTLSNGQKIVLDSMANGELAKDANISVIKKDGEITYQGKTDAVVYNTIATAKGRQWQLMLPDGSKVWLNAASSIRYPLSFTGRERAVEITGEAYFEVKHNTRLPFRVYINTPSGDGGIIEDLGTNFNINAYADEQAVKTTLLQGSVKVSSGPSSSTAHSPLSIVLNPGQQAVYTPSKNKGGTIRVEKDIDTDLIMAWKDGCFQFDEADLPTITRQLSRWYNVEVFYEGRPGNRKFFGRINRNMNLSAVLQVLEANKVHFRIEDNRLFVTP